jgi:hypothetical protein
MIRPVGQAIRAQGGRSIYNLLFRPRSALVIRARATAWWPSLGFRWAV